MGHDSAFGAVRGFLQSRATLVCLRDLNRERCNGIKKLVNVREKCGN